MLEYALRSLLPMIILYLPYYSTPQGSNLKAELIEQTVELPSYYKTIVNLVQRPGFADIIQLYKNFCEYNALSVNVQLLILSNEEALLDLYISQCRLIKLWQIL